MTWLDCKTYTQPHHTSMSDRYFFYRSNPQVRLQVTVLQIMYSINKQDQKCLLLALIPNQNVVFDRRGKLFGLNANQ